MRLSLLLGSVLALSVAAACSSSSSPTSGSNGDAGSTSSSSGGSSSGASSSSSGSGTDEGGLSADGAATDTWASWAQGFFTKYCVECHAAGNSAGLDFGQQAIVVTNADTIRCGVCVTQDPAWNCPSNLPAKQFPISDKAGTNPKPTDAERDRVVAWIDAGAP